MSAPVLGDVFQLEFCAMAALSSDLRAFVEEEGAVHTQNFALFGEAEVALSRATLVWKRPLLNAPCHTGFFSARFQGPDMTR